MLRDFNCENQETTNTGPINNGWLAHAWAVDLCLCLMWIVDFNVDLPRKRIRFIRQYIDQNNRMKNNTSEIPEKKSIKIPHKHQRFPKKPIKIPAKHPAKIPSPALQMALTMASATASAASSAFPSFARARAARTRLQCFG